MTANGRCRLWKILKPNVQNACADLYIVSENTKKPPINRWFLSAQPLGEFSRADRNTSADAFLRTESPERLRVRGLQPGCACGNAFCEEKRGGSRRKGKKTAAAPIVGGRSGTPTVSERALREDPRSAARRRRERTARCLSGCAGGNRCGGRIAWPCRESLPARRAEYRRSA